MFKSNGSGAFSVSLPNGYDVSVAFGEGNYCSNRNGEVRDGRNSVTCPNAEMAVFKTGTNDMVNLASVLGLAGSFPFGEAGMVLSWADPAHFVALVAAVAELPDWRSDQAAPAAAAMPPANVAGSGGPHGPQRGSRTDADVAPRLLGSARACRRRLVGRKGQHGHPHADDPPHR
jgi:hypothetical protein